MSRHETPARHAAPVRPRGSTDETTVDPIERTTLTTVVDEAPGQTAPRRWDAVTNQWATLRRDLRAGARMVRHIPGHAVEDPHAERVAAAAMGLLVLVGAIVTYVAVVGGIDPLPSQSPAGGAPPAVVPSFTPAPRAGPATTPAPDAAPPSEPTTTRPRPGPATRPTTTSTPPVPGPTPTPTPTSSGPTPTPSPSPSP